MWKRRELKDYAKGFLKQNYWKAFIVVLFTIILISVISDSFSDKLGVAEQTFRFLKDNDLVSFKNDAEYALYEYIYTNFKPFTIATIVVSSIDSIIIGLILMAFMQILNVGKAKFFLDGFNGDVNINKLFTGFTTKDFLPIIKTQLLSMFYIFLWTLLFIIPGFIKAYQYRYVHYILSEDSSLSSKEILRKSKEMTKGHKWNIFVLDLSFILWDLLALITFGISGYFVAPYAEATNARLYTVLKDRSDMQYE